MKLWRFIDKYGTFLAGSPDKISRLYFPLANEAGLMSSITPDLHGDIKTGQNSFLTIPVSEQDLHLSRANRNFWIYIKGKGHWSTTGVSCSENKQNDKVWLEAGHLWHRVNRENKKIGLRAEMTNFVPNGSYTVELMQVHITNIGKKPIRIIPTSAIPIYGRSADNLHDHRHVTSLLHRIYAHNCGIVVRPVMSFDERGHKRNELSYVVLGCEGDGAGPVGSFPSVDEFIGEGGNLEAPSAVIKNLTPPAWTIIEGREAMGALRFGARSLSPAESASYILILGITDNTRDIEKWIDKFGSSVKFENALSNNRQYWKERIDTISFKTGDEVFDNWMRWVTLQPALRKISGCSFLPDFDYGKGGRGWRDLWQDCLALILAQPENARHLLLNNYAGIRTDGSNATIIGKGPGEFIADRNNVSRTWMDHGVWPLLTTISYIHKSGDFSLLQENAPYFSNNQDNGRENKSQYGSIIEHILVQHIVRFFDVGDHNIIRLLDADWNDGLDMAKEKGESVAFSAMYAANLSSLTGLLVELKKRYALEELQTAEELGVLLDRTNDNDIDYDSVEQKRQALAAYLNSVEPGFSGRKITVSVENLIHDISSKSQWLSEHIRKQEWLTINEKSHGKPQKFSFFNGYYDNNGHQLEGKFTSGIRMTLTGQVFPVMAAVASEKQIREIWKSVHYYLRDTKLGGFHLNTNFMDTKPDMGRAFSFAYGEKENGAYFNHMVIMFANALYRRGFVNEGREVLRSIYDMAIDTEKSNIYPGLPEYFNGSGRGMYHYLTGSASWFIMTYMEWVLGVRGLWGDLLLDPRLTAKDFADSKLLSAKTRFAGRNLRIIYNNQKRYSYGQYCISHVQINGAPVEYKKFQESGALISLEKLKELPEDQENQVKVEIEAK